MTLKLSVVSAILSPMHMEMRMAIIMLQQLSVILKLLVALAILSPAHTRVRTVSTPIWPSPRRSQAMQEEITTHKPPHATLKLLVALAILSLMHTRMLMVNMPVQAASSRGQPAVQQL